MGPQVSSVYAKSLKYSQTATIYIIGKYLRTDVMANAPSCINPSYGPDSTTDTLVLHCKVTKTGALPITIQASGGAVLLTDTLAMARTSDPNSATSEFFINVVDNSFLDYTSPEAPTR